MSHTPLQSAQRGAVPIVGIIVIVLLLLVASTVAYFALTSRSTTSLQAVPPEVSPDDRLTEGNSNGELVIDGSIIKAGLDRDDKQRKAAETALNDEPLEVGDVTTADTVVQEQSLTAVQTQFIAEADRRLENLAKADKEAQKLDPAQKPAVGGIISAEVDKLTDLKAKAAAETARLALEDDIQALEAEYVDYVLAASQSYLLRWATDQSTLNEKINVFGGKLQERLNDISNEGTSIAQAQTLMNSYQANKTGAKDATTAATEAILKVKAGTYEANRAVLKTYYTQLARAHEEISNGLTTAQDVVRLIASYKQ